MKNRDRYKTPDSRVNAYLAENVLHSGPRELLYSFAEWLEQEERHEQPLPCPCCGGKKYSKTDGIANPRKCIICDQCGYRSPFEFDLDVAVRRHNEICRVIEAGRKALDIEGRSGK